MRIVEAVKLEDCFDGSALWRYGFETGWSRDGILALRAVGALQYFPTFPRPYFRLRTLQGLIAQGVEGESSCRVTFPRHHQEDVQRDWEARFPAVSVEEGLWLKS